MYSMTAVLKLFHIKYLYMHYFQNSVANIGEHFKLHVISSLQVSGLSKLLCALLYHQFSNMVFACVIVNLFLFCRIAISLNAEAALGGKTNQKHNIGEKLS